ncbi:unnamed protein product [Nesidiocoris tenuis]|uniref:Uncharacterized protein n=1 Tax=Nesidiocoris tenuis TaxID=355587 RepID=A0A6H5GJN3_9HEMI|nr:unnamed protein product [Nesidiocoris tenuis]
MCCARVGNNTTVSSPAYDLKIMAQPLHLNASDRSSLKRMIIQKFRPLAQFYVHRMGGALAPVLLPVATPDRAGRSKVSKSTHGDRDETNTEFWNFGLEKIRISWIYDRSGTSPDHQQNRIRRANSEGGGGSSPTMDGYQRSKSCNIDNVTL